MPRPSRLDEAKEAVWGILQEIARKGERCPTLDRLGRLLELRGLSINHASTVPPMLAREGRIRIEISARNWRVVEIRQGKHKGKRTKESATAAKPYLVIDTNGSHQPLGFNRQGRLGRDQEPDGFEILGNSYFR